MKKSFKALSAILAVIMLVTLLPIAALALDLDGDSTVDNVTIRTIVPSNLDFALDPLELDSLSTSQIASANYVFANKTVAPIKVDLNLTLTHVAGVTLVTDPSTLAQDDTSVTTKDIYFGSIGATAVDTANDLDILYVPATDTAPIMDYPAAPDSAATMTPFKADGTTTISFALAAAADLVNATDAVADPTVGPAGSDGYGDALAANDKGVAAFQFYGQLNTYAAWQAGDLTIDGTYTLTALRATTYANYTTNSDYIAGSLNQLDLSVPVTGITVTGQGNASSVIVDETLQMNAAIEPAGATNGGVTWTVAPLVDGTATIDAAGLLTATGIGTVTVTATAKDGSGITGTKVITITAAPVLVTSLTVTGAGDAITVTNGGALQMAAAANADATDSSVTWSVVAGSGTATINGTGLLTGTGEGTVTVTATANDGSNVTGTLEVTVTAAPIALTGLTVTGTGNATTVAGNGTLQMIATPTPSDATNPAVTWSVTGGVGASINASGMLTAGTELGDLVVTATSVANNAITATKTITVTHSGPGFTTGTSAIAVLNPGATPVLTSSKASAAQQSVGFYFNGLTITSIKIGASTIPVGEYSITGGNTLNFIKTSSGCALRSLTAGTTATLVMTLSNGTTSTFNVSITA